MIKRRPYSQDNNFASSEKHQQNLHQALGGTAGAGTVNDRVTAKHFLKTMPSPISSQLVWVLLELLMVLALTPLEPENPGGF